MGYFDWISDTTKTIWQLPDHLAGGLTKRIGVVGFGMSGKTVFITSLINHLKSHDPKRNTSPYNRFVFLEDDVRICGLQDEQKPTNSIWKRFAYGEHWGMMVKSKEWPDRTTDCSCYTLNFRIQKGGNVSWMRYYLTLYDIPGERMADIVMYGNKNDYWEWSRQQIIWLQDCLDKNPNKTELAPIRKYLDLAEGMPTDADEASIVVAYKTALICMSHSINISPSYFSLDENGVRLKNKLDAWEAARSAAEKRAAQEKIRPEENSDAESAVDTGMEQEEEVPSEEKSDAESAVDAGMEQEEVPSEEKSDAGKSFAELLQSCCSGLPGREFAPLGKSWNEKKKKGKDHATVGFIAHYEKYKKEVVNQIFGTLISCDGLAVLVDIPHILTDGYMESYGDYQGLLKNILKGLNPGPNLLRRLGTLGISKRIERLAFIASQCDRFHPEDWELLESMIYDIADESCNDFAISENSWKAYFCSAVHSVKKEEDGQLTWRDKKKQKVFFSPFRIPWEGGWPQGEYQWDELKELGAKIPKPIPDYLMEDKKVPCHVNMDKIFRFLTRWGEEQHEIEEQEGGEE